jgi:hypothetical protein
MGILTWNRLSHAVEKYAIGTYTCANVLAPYKTWDVVTFHRRKNGNAEKLFFFSRNTFLFPHFFHLPIVMCHSFLPPVCTHGAAIF